MRLINSSRRGVTLVETMIAISIMAFIFAFTGFLIVMSARNAYNLNLQIQSQGNASNACERSAALLRQASYYAMWPGDDIQTTTTFSRVRFALPAPGNTVTTHVLCYNPAKERLEYYVSEADVFFAGMKNGIPVPQGKPTYSYPRISSFRIRWETEYRLTLVFSFEYAGYAFRHGDSRGVQFGQLITDVIARNHFMDEGIQNYAEADNATSSPATL